MNLFITTRKRTRKDGTTNVVFAITHKRKIRYLKTDVYILPTEFNHNSQEVEDNADADDYNIELGELKVEYQKKLREIKRRARHMDVNEIVSYLRGNITEGEDRDFLYVSEVYISELRKEGRTNYANSIKQTVNDVALFIPTVTLDFDQIDQGWLKRYKRHREVKGSSVNTIAVHLRNIRTIYNYAIKQQFISPEGYPFRGFDIQTKRNGNRDLSVEDVRAIIAVEGLSPIETRYRDLWLLSFYLVGINFKDLLLATHDNVKRGRLEYVRSKTMRRKKQIETISIKIEPEARKLLDKYKGKKHLLSFVEERKPVQSKKEDKIERPVYKDVVDHANRALKRIGSKAGLDISLSTYYARHSWATTAYNHCRVSEDTIAFALGHASAHAVTAGYIHKDSKLVDEANRKVINKILGLK